LGRLVEKKNGRREKRNRSSANAKKVEKNFPTITTRRGKKNKATRAIFWRNTKGKSGTLRLKAGNHPEKAQAIAASGWCTEKHQANFAHDKAKKKRGFHWRQAIREKQGRTQRRGDGGEKKIVRAPAQQKRGGGGLFLAHKAKK